MTSELLSQSTTKAKSEVDTRVFRVQGEEEADTCEACSAGENRGSNGTPKVTPDKERRSAAALAPSEDQNVNQQNCSTSAQR